MRRSLQRAVRAGSAAPRFGRWAFVGVLLGGLMALVGAAPAHWLATGIGHATGGHLLLAEARGTVWRGSAVMLLTGGSGSRDASALPGRMDWRLSPAWRTGPAFALRAEQACCINGSLTVLLRPGLGRMTMELLPDEGWAGQWPSAWLTGLGTPWNTLQLGGQLRLHSRGLTVESVQGRWRLTGMADVELRGLSSRLSSLPVLGHYRLRLQADPDSPGNARLNLSTQEGALLLSGDGHWDAGGLRLRGEARAAAPADEAVLGNLLNIIGRRQGASSVISIG